jgi:hypothetical protein
MFAKEGADAFHEMTAGWKLDVHATLYEFLPGLTSLSSFAGGRLL